jgi:serine/threonine protein kinase
VEVVHGDVSPANVVLGADGPVLVDFGVGGVDTSPGDRARTPLVAAPERLRGGRATASADVWSASATVEWATDPAAPVTESTRRVLADCRHPLAARRPTAVEVVERLGPPGSDPEG